MVISVVISTMGRPETLYRILGCLSKQTTLVNEIIIIEASGFKWDLDNYPLENIYIHYEKGMSLSDARSLGLKLSHSKYVAFLDDDIIIDNNYINTAINFLDNNKEYNGVGGAYEDAITKARTKLSLTIGKAFYIYGNGDANKIISSGWADYVRRETEELGSDAEWLFGCNGVYRKEALLGLDDREQMIKWSFLEDVILGVKLTKKYGITLRILSDLMVIHDPQATSGEYNKQTLRMRVLYRHIFYRDILEKKNLFKYSLSCAGNILLLLKSDFSIRNLTEITKVYIFLISNWNSINWGVANEYILKKH